MNLRFTIYDLRLTRPTGLPFVITLLLFAVSLQAMPTRKTSDEIPPLDPPLPVIPPGFLEQHGWLVWIAILFVLLLAAIVTAFLLRPRKPPMLPAADVQARAALTAMQARSEDGATLSEISQALRRYLNVTFWLHPDETTTAEFCAALAANKQVGSELAGAISEFLKHCDERKFSPGHSSPPLDAARRALKLVELAEVRRAQQYSGQTAN